METKAAPGLFDDTGWGKDNLGSGSKTSNPYQSETMNRPIEGTTQRDIRAIPTQTD